ncbi:MAG: NUDIX domain-containing protein [Spirochaetales bacterium]|nr:NUDIX domain-containing protein [Spirochaetales bacterium]
MIVSTAGIAVKNGNFLLALRKPGSSIGESWEFPGGKAEDGESPEEALKREFLEELNLEVTVGERICRGYFTNNAKEYEIYGFSVDLTMEGVKLTEHSSINWFTLEEMESLKMAGSDRQIVESLKYLSLL